ncbi:MAG: phosphomannomutase/phosphoglucomutase [Clostridia bacterium]|nr:phosphomannomutase/phosphoglucomutase [Clostridia bacterium]
MANYLPLQNGSDIRGVSVSTESGEANFTPEAAFRLARSFAAFLSKRTGKDPAKISVYVGHDSRITAIPLSRAALSGVISTGANAFYTGLSSTPSMFMSTVFEEFRADGAIMITASHLPYNRNGMKFFDARGGLEKSDIKELIIQAGDDESPYAPNDGFTPTFMPLMDRYCRFLRDKIKEGVGALDYEHPLSGLKIIVDAGNGAGGFFVKKVLNPLGADTSGSLYLEPDGMFPNHEPNPENAAAMDSLCRAVKDSGADMGLIFDTDVDRAAAVDKNGRPINRNAIVALAAAIVSTYCPGSIVVTDSVTSDKLTEFLENDLKMTHKRFKRGYKNVINEAIRLNRAGLKCELAIETSGHCALGENYFLDDGAYLTVKIIIEASRLLKKGKTIDSLISGLKEAKEAKEFRLKIAGEDFSNYGKLVLHDFEEFARESGYDVAENSYEGVRVSFSDIAAQGWLLLRMSLHDPLLPLNIESDNEGGVREIAHRVMEFLKKYPMVDVSPLANY